MKRKVIFRADGNAKIGFGHFIRSLALAEMLKNDFQCIFAIQSPSPNQIQQIQNICPEHWILPGDESHFNLFLNYLKGDEIVVLDNYYYSTDYQKLIKKKCFLVCIDDLHDKHFVADIVINHAEGITKGSYSGERYTQYLLGFKYALLRKNFLDKEELNAIPKYSCVIMMGGSDPFHLTKKISSLIGHFNSDLPIVVIVGENLKNQTGAKFGNNIEYCQISAEEVKMIMCQSEFGIFPASTVAIEACAVRLPFICGYFIDNQKDMYHGLKIQELAICIGNFLAWDERKISDSIQKIKNPFQTKAIKRNQSELLDKRSPDRFIKIFKDL